MNIQPYLYFDGRAEEAINFYRNALGAEAISLMRFRECPQPTPQLDAGNGDKIMHAELRIGETVLMISDGDCRGASVFQGFSLSLTVANEAEAERVYNGLSDGGRVEVPLGPTFFAKRFGWVFDRFGVSWMVLYR